MKVPSIEPLEARIAPAVVSIVPVDASKAEGNTLGGTTGFQFKIILDTAEPQDVTVLATIQDGTATLADGDFNAFSQTVTIPKGQTEAIFTVPIRQDSTIEGDETFSVKISDPSANAFIGTTDTATATILNDDFPTVSIAAVTGALLEGSATGGVTEFEFKLTLSADVTQPSRVTVKIVDGTATLEDGDFGEFTQVVEFLPGEREVIVRVPIKQDTKIEGNETFSVQLSDAEGLTIGTGSATATIQNDDPPSLSVEDAQVLEGAAGETSKLRFKVKLSTEAAEDVTFDWETVAGSATEGVDFSNITRTTVTIPAGESEVFLEVDILGDNVDELDETLSVFLSNARLGTGNITVTDATAVGTIQNDELRVNLSGPATVEEKTPDPENPPQITNATYTLSLDQVSAHATSVVLEFVNGSATRGSDFTAPETVVVNIPAGQTTANFTVPITIDALFEGDETYEVRIKSVTNAAPGALAAVTTTIVDDDEAPTLTVVDTQVTETDGEAEVSIVVNLSAPSGNDVTFDWSTLEGTAVAGLDFTAVSNQPVTIPAGQTSVTLVVKINGDEKVYDQNETFSIVLSNVTGATPGNGGVGTVTIIEDEAAPIVSISDAVAIEGAGPNPRLSFRVEITNDVTTDDPITVDWIAGAGTATAGVDYTLASSTPITIPAGETFATIDLNVLDDAIDEGDETVFVTLASAKIGSGASEGTVPIGDNQATGRIQNDEVTVNIQAPLVSIIEGDEDTQVATFRITLDQPTTRAVTMRVQFDAEASTASLGSDFTLPADTFVTIPAGATEAEFQITINSDVVFEGSETIVLKLVDVMNAAPGAGSASLTIADDEAVPPFIADATLDEGDDGIRVMEFVVSLPGPAADDVTFDWFTTNGTAIAGQDYTGVTLQSGMIEKGQVQTTIRVALSGDTDDELDETFFVNLTNVRMGGVEIPVDDAVAQGTIENDDTLVRISGATITEGDAGQQNLQFVVSLEQASQNDVTVNFEVADGTAKAGLDYLLPAGMSVTIPAGQTQAIISVPVLGDQIDEAGENFFVNLTSAINAKILSATGEGRIVDNDAPPTISIGDRTIVEGNSGSQEVQFEISLSQVSGQDVTVVVTPSGGTATLGSDVTGTAQTITIKAGELTALFTMQVNGDTLFETDEQFTVKLSSAQGALIADSEATGTITNDDAKPTLVIDNVAKVEGPGGATTFDFVIRLSEPSGVPLTFTAATNGTGTATAGTDYVAKTQNFTIPAGQTTATFSVTVLNDALFEGRETFGVELTGLNPDLVTVLNSTATGTIVDDEAAPTLSVGDVTVLEGDSGTSIVEVTVSMSRVAGSDVTFDWTTFVPAGVAATLGEDYTIESTSPMTIPQGQTSAKLRFIVNGDTAVEADEVFGVRISNAQVGAETLEIADNEATVTLQNDDVTVSVADANVIEGNSGTRTIEFVVTLSQPSSQTITLNYSTQDGTAVSTGTRKDFDAVTDQTLTFAPGQTTQSIFITVHGDTDFDGTDSFQLLLSNATNARLADGQATGTITDDEPWPAISIDANVARAEDAEDPETPGRTPFTFTVRLDRASDEPVEVSVSTVAGTAQAGIDFTAITNQRLVFAPGETEKTVTVEVLNDAIHEGDETFTLKLSDPLRGTLGTAERTGTIQPDGDEAPTLQVLGHSILEGNDGERFLSFVVQRTGSSEVPATVTFRTVDGTATAGIDYEAKVETVTFEAGETTKTVLVRVFGDSVDEADETLTAQLENATGASITTGSATGTIFNDDLTVRLAAGPFEVLEGNTGDTDLVFTVQLSAASTHATTVNYTVANGTAQSGSDYRVPTVLSIVIPAGQTTGEIRIPVIGDTTPENNETLTVTLTGGVNAELDSTDTTATGTILSDDASLSISDATIVEGASGTKMMQFRVTLASPESYPVTVHYATAPGSATAGADYTHVEGDVTFGIGQTEQTIEVPVVGDVTVEGDETFSVVLSNPTGAAILDGTAEGRIIDDESGFRIDDFTVTEGDTGTKTMIFTVTRTPGSSLPASVRVSTVDGTAVSTGNNPDFVEKSEVISFAAGETTKTFAVVVNGDRVFEPSVETFRVVLSEPSNAAILDGEAIGTITNSADVAPTVTITDASIVEGNGGTQKLRFVVTLSQAADSDVEFDFSTAFSTGAGAADASDFTPVGQTFVIPAGERTFEVEVDVIGDTVDEVDETFLGNIAAARIGGTNLVVSDGQAVGTIRNDDVIVSVVDGAFVEGTGTNQTANIRVQLSNPSNHPVSVTFTLTPGTATAGTDYVAPTNFTAVIPANQSFVDIPVQLLADALDEDDETFTITLTGATNAVLGEETATVTITDDDAAPVITIDDVTTEEGSDAVFTVQLSAPSTKDIVIRWVTEPVFDPDDLDAGYSADPGNGTTTGDYEHFGTVQTLVIPAGQTTGTISIGTRNDSDAEVDEVFKLRIVEVENGTLDSELATNGATATIEGNDFGGISIDDASITEGNSALPGEAKTLTFTVRRTGSLTLPAKVNYTTSNGGALSGIDFVHSAGTVEFGANEATKTITITILGDTINELDENFFVTLSDPENAVIADAFATGTILNDEVTYKVAANSAVVNEGAGTATFTITRNLAGNAGTVFYATAANTAEGAIQATAGSDYTAVSGSVTFAANELTKTVTVPITADDLAEGAETFLFRLTSSINGVISDEAGEKETVQTIADDDAGQLPQVVVSNATLVEGADGETREMVFKVRLVGPDGTTARSVSGDVVVRYSTSNGSATSPGDYTAAAPDATITFSAGQTEREIRIPIIGDGTDEPDETFFVQLDGAKFVPAGATNPEDHLDMDVQDAAATGTILNDDLTLTLDPVEGLTEGNTTRQVEFVLRISEASSHDVTVRVSTKAGTATSNGVRPDFVEIADQLVTIPAGQTSASFFVTVNGDQYVEGDENFILEFSDVSGAAFDASPRTVTLVNDDATPGISIGDASVVEGNDGQAELVFDVLLSGGTLAPVTVDFSTVDGTAKSSGVLRDFLARSGTLTFAPSEGGIVTQTVRVPVIGDTWKEGTEEFTVLLSNARLDGSASGVAIVDAEGEGTILDDGDNVLGIVLNDAKVAEGNSGRTNLTFTIETTAPLDSAVTLRASTRAGSATVADFTSFTDREVVIAAGQSSATITVEVTGDTFFETAEFLHLDVTGFGSEVVPVGANGGTVTAYGIILNDDIRAINAREFQYVDSDGDLVRVKFSKGTLSVPTGTALSSSDFTFVRSTTNDVGGRFLQLIDLTNDGLEFEGASITITAVPQVLVTGEVLGNGKTEVGAIDAMRLANNVFTITQGVGLGAVKIDGSLGRIFAGSFQRIAGIGSLEVDAMGEDSNLPNGQAGLPANASVVFGPIGKMVVHGDFSGTLNVVGDVLGAPFPGDVGKINTLEIQGNLVGGTAQGSGQIAVTGHIGRAVLGGILGGSGDASGSLQAIDPAFDVFINSLTILGDVVGGSGANSGSVLGLSRIGSLTFGKLGTGGVEASLQGGSGSGSGRIDATTIGNVIINGSLQGGSGQNSGQIDVTESVRSLRVTGDIRGGSGSQSGLFVAGAMPGRASIEGNIVGGSGSTSGLLALQGFFGNSGAVAGNLGSLVLGKAGVIGSGNLIGGDGDGSGRVFVDGSLGSLLVHGDITGLKPIASGADEAESANGSGVGGVDVGETLRKAVIKGNLIGGNPDLGSGGNRPLGSGFVLAGRIGSLTVEGSIRSGEDSLGAVALSGAIHSNTSIQTLKVFGKGNAAALEGTAAVPVTISAVSSFGNVQIGGDVRYAEILAGYNRSAELSQTRGPMIDAGATIGKVSVAGKWVGSSLVAGVYAGGDGRFGTVDDTQTTNGTNSAPGNRGLISRIARVVVRSVEAPADVPAGASYGIVAEQLGKVTIGATRVSLLPGPHNDLLDSPPPANRLQIFEI